MQVLLTRSALPKAFPRALSIIIFKTKDDLFLACVEECFCLLTEYLRSKMQDAESDTERQLEEYFAVRMSFFTEYPIYQRIFAK